MRPATLVDATDLTSWARRRDAQALLPQLIRRLIHATVDGVVRAGFRAGEGVQLEGWDGLVVVEQGNAFVPDGVSAWELGTGDAPKSKADNDYVKRTRDPLGVDRAQSAFVFVTLRRWSGKEKWCAARKAEGVWCDVRVYDADDLEQWLELAPAVHHWCSVSLGKHPEGAVDLDTYWADWSEVTRPALTPELVLAGRANVVQRVHAWLSDSTSSLAIQAESREEAIAVFAAALQQLPPERRIAKLSRSLIVRDDRTWYHLAVGAKPLILVPLVDVRNLLPRAIRAGHRVAVPLGRADSASKDTLVVPRLGRAETVEALVACGLVEERARELALLARRSLTSFRRALAVQPEVHQPEWARPAEGRFALPALLAGAWVDTREADRAVLATLAHQPYDRAVEDISRWSHEADPPVRRVGEAWFIVSKADALSELGRYLSNADLKSFGDVVVEALGEPDPRFELPSDKQYMAGALGKVRPHSNLLLEGLADTLALLGSRGDRVSPGGPSAAEWARKIVRRLLERANSDWRVWASLAESRAILRIAEAAPDEFLDAVDTGLAGESPLLLRLFNDESDEVFASAPHTGLLWALEVVAWSPDYLGRAALLLARLARIDPGGKLANRPRNSLRDIFLPWYPQTSAPLDRRLAVIDVLRAQEPAIAAQLLCDLLPEPHGLAQNNAKPQWREWASDSPPSVTRAEYASAVRELVSRMLADAGSEGAHWSALVEAIPSLPQDQRARIVADLRQIAPDDLDSSSRGEAWGALRRVISRHRSFPDSDWALAADEVDELAGIYERFLPKEFVARYAWLFDESPDLPEGHDANFDEYERMVLARRTAAVRDANVQAGLSGLLALAGTVERPHEVGFLIGESEMLKAEEDEVLQVNLAAEGPTRQFARGFAGGRVSNRGRSWAEAKLSDAASAWSALARAELLLSLPSDQMTWDLVDAADEETTSCYWSLVGAYAFLHAESAEWAARRLLEHGRAYAAVDLLAVHRRRYGPAAGSLIADVLEAVGRMSDEQESSHGASSRRHVSELLELIEDAGDLPDRRVAAIEWAFLPLYRHGGAPKRLQRELGINPTFFVEVLALVFHAEGEDPSEPSAENTLRASRAHDLLKSWHTVPGTGEDGSIDPQYLDRWITEARQASAASGRGAIGDEVIGEMLSGSPAEPDGAWPQANVRDVIERVASIDLERGVEIGVYNRRGVFARSLTEGGAQERLLADRYARLATALADSWPRTAAMLRRIAEQYHSDARCEDREAELVQDLEP